MPEETSFRATQLTDHRYHLGVMMANKKSYDGKQKKVMIANKKLLRHAIIFDSSKMHSEQTSFFSEKQIPLKCCTNPIM